VTSRRREAENNDWTRHEERGSRFALWFIVGIGLALGRPAARFAAAFAVAWYLLRAHSHHRHVYAFLRRALSRPPRFRDLLRTYWNFAAVTLDRLFLIAGREAGFDIRVHGGEILDDLAARGEGAILLGAHLGSFLALRALGKRRRGYTIRVLQYREQSPMMTRIVAKLNPGLAADVIPLGEPDVLLKLAHCTEAGGIVALLADRMGPREKRAVTCDFLGAPVTLPSGGVEAALVLGCPVLLFFGLYRGGNRYELYFERLDLGTPRGRLERRAALERGVRQYAERLAHYARIAPYNWFNFYDYWG
jgi:predicted LPLAT superfamily acyltransferase